jgi:hypothetical protein
MLPKSCETSAEASESGGLVAGGKTFTLLLIFIVRSMSRLPVLDDDDWVI